MLFTEIPFFFFLFLVSAMAVTHYKDYLGFGAPTAQSYGCCYCMTQEKLLMVISGNATCKEKDVDRFKQHVIQSLLDLAKVLQHGAGSKV